MRYSYSFSLILVSIILSSAYTTKSFRVKKKGINNTYQLFLEFGAFLVCLASHLGDVFLESLLEAVFSLLIFLFNLFLTLSFNLFLLFSGFLFGYKPLPSNLIVLVLSHSIELRTSIFDGLLLCFLHFLPFFLFRVLCLQNLVSFGFLFHTVLFSILCEQLLAHLFKFFVHNSLFNGSCLIQLYAQRNVWVSANHATSRTISVMMMHTATNFICVCRSGCSMVNWAFAEVWKCLFQLVEGALLDSVFNEVDLAFALVLIVLVSSASNPLRNVLVHEVLHRPSHTAQSVMTESSTSNRLTYMGTSVSGSIFMKAHTSRASLVI